MEASRKRFATPARQSNVRDPEEGGGGRACATLLLVTAAEGASGEGGEGTSLDMRVISGVGFFFKLGGGDSRPKTRKRAKL